MSSQRLIFVGGFRAMGGWVNVVVRLGLAIDNVLVADTCLPVHVPLVGAAESLFHCPVELCCLYSNTIW